MSLDHLPDTSRVWFFGSESVLNESQIESLSHDLDAFISNWKAHGSDLMAGYQILHDCILLIAVDESHAPPTGCSIDKAFKLLEKQPSKWFNRLLIWQAFCNTGKVYTVDELRDSISRREMNLESLVFNSTVSNLKEVRDNAYIPVGETWVANKINR